MDDDHYRAFCADLKAGVSALIGGRNQEVQDRQDAMFRRLRGTNTSGMSFPTSSFSVYAIRDEFHLNFPSAIADAATVEAVKAVLAEVSERHGVELRVRKDVRGGSNYVLEGRLEDAPAPSPAP